MGNSIDKMRWSRWYDQNKRKVLMLFFNKEPLEALISHFFEEELEKSNTKVSSLLLLNDFYTNELVFEDYTLRLWVSNSICLIYKL